jgi:hypothetical protein
LYREKGIRWPPDLALCRSYFDVSQLSVRAQEAAWFLHNAFDPTGQVQFVDVQKSLGRLITRTPDGVMNNPWRDVLTGLTGHGKIVVRYTTQEPNDPWTVRSLLPAEYFAAMGWFPDSFVKGISFATPLLPASLAGNAFSAFHFGPFLMAAFGVAGSFERQVPGGASSSAAADPSSPQQPALVAVSDDSDSD